MPLILPGNVGSATAGGYEVANSLRFNTASNDSLTKTFSSAGNRAVWTWSAWMKVGGDAGFNGLFTVGQWDGGSTATGVILYANTFNTYWNAPNGGTSTSAKYRDPSAWYHVVLQANTSTLKLYVNGAQQTSRSISGDGQINNGSAEHAIGRYSGAGSTFNGYMSEIVFIDGTALDPTSFGEFDSISEIWKPKDVSGLTFGDNGFYLEFKQSGTSQNSSGLGADTSGNDNHWAVNNLTAVDQSTDTCTNNFATMNPLDNYLQAHAFSDGNLTVTTTNASQSYNTSSILLTSGKWYVECKPVSGGSEPEIGVANKMVLLNAGNNAQLSYNANGYGYRASDPGTVWYNGEYVTNALVAYANGDIIGIALDLDNNKLYFSKNGTFANSQDPTNGTNAVSIVDPASTGIGGYVFAMNENFNDQNKVFSWNFGSPSYAISSGNTDGNGYGNFEYAPPSGYFACCTKNLAENG